jgi:hypothetical protein
MSRLSPSHGVRRGGDRLPRLSPRPGVGRGEVRLPGSRLSPSSRVGRGEVCLTGSRLSPSPGSGEAELPMAPEAGLSCCQSHSAGRRSSQPRSSLVCVPSRSPFHLCSSVLCRSSVTVGPIVDSSPSSPARRRSPLCSLPIATFLICHAVLESR